MKIEKLACPSCGAPLPADLVPNQRVECKSCGSILVASDLETDTSIVCPTCQTSNEGHLRFCIRCGANLKVDCVMCHTTNRVDTINCSNCGVHLERARARRQRSLEAKQKLVQERNKAFKIKSERQKREKLARLLEDLDEPENHEYAISSLVQMGPDAITPLIDTLLHDEDIDARYGSARALGKICYSQSVGSLIRSKVSKALIQALDDPEPPVRYWAAEALGKLSGRAGQTAVKPLGAKLKDSHQGVRQQAQKSLEKIGGKQAQKLLEEDSHKGFLGWIIKR